MDIPPLKDEKYRVCLTVGGDKLEFLGNTSSVAAFLATSVKVLLNNVVSTDGAIFTTADIEYFFYGSHLPDPEYMKIPLKLIPEEIVQQCNLNNLQVDVWVYVNIVKDIPGLKQAAKLANDRLISHITPMAMPQSNIPLRFGPIHQMG